MTLPLYILRRSVEPGGVRLKKLTTDLVAGLCEACSRPVLRKKIMNVEQIDGRYLNYKLYHHGCMPEVGYVSPYRRPRGKEAIGNLEEAEYRYWIGSKDEWSSFSMCRACRFSAYSAVDREKHTKDEALAVGGERCCGRLVKAYKALEISTICVVCKQLRYNNTKWGVPLCNSAHCQAEWKYSLERWIPIENQLMMQKKAAYVEAAVKPAREWCEQCGMMTDNVAHPETHTAWSKLLC